MAPCQTVAVGMAPYKRTALGIRSNRLRTREPRLEWLRVRLWQLECHRTRGPRLEEGKLGSVREDRAWHLQSRSLCRWLVLESSLVCESCFQGHWPGRRQGHQTFLIGGGRWLALPMSSREGHGQVALFCKARWVGVKESTGGKSETQGFPLQVLGESNRTRFLVTSWVRSRTRFIPGNEPPSKTSFRQSCWDTS